MHQILVDFLCLLNDEPIENKENVILEDVIRKNLKIMVSIDMEPDLCAIIKEGILQVIAENIQKNASEAVQRAKLEYYLNIKGYAEGEYAVLEFVNTGKIENI